MGAYKFIGDYKDLSEYRQGLNELTRKTFGFSFEPWYQKGFWGKRYIPYSLAVEDQIVANVSVNDLVFDFEGKGLHALQIGTVMTDAKVRGEGLSRKLMEDVLKLWRDKVDFIYLFANDSVRDFYPKFGFRKVREIQWSASRSEIENLSRLQPKEQGCVFRQLNPQMLRDFRRDQEDDLLHQLMDRIRNGSGKSALAMLDNVDLVMFYLTGFMSHHVYHTPDGELFAVCEEEEGVLHIHEVYGQGVSLVSVAAAMSRLMDLEGRPVHTVVLGFTPKETHGFTSGELMEEDHTLFVLDGENPSFDHVFLRNGLIFPVLSRA